ncbi:MAG: DUF4900 domain-containing protein [Candidatus Eisenbacteria bacterium]
MLTRNELVVGQSGSTLAIVVILSFVMLVTIAAVFELGVQDAGLAARNEDSIQALFLAEGGLSEGVTWLKVQSIPPSGVSAIEPFGASPDTLGAGNYYVTIQPDMGNPGRSQKMYTISSTGNMDSKSRTLTRDVTTQSFAQFIYFTDLECMAGTGTPIWFMSHDYLDGPMHSNGHIHIMGNPYFGGHLTSAWGGPGDADPSHNPTFVYHNNGWGYVESSAPNNDPHDHATFHGGYELGSTYIELPDCLDDLKAMSQSGGLYLNGNYQVQFSRVVDGSPMWGTLSYKPFQGGSWVDVSLSSINGAVYVDGLSRVWGTLDGVVTVASSGNMSIMNDLVYRDADPVNGPNPGCDDILGLVSESNIIVDDNSANRNDCNIHAHMMALDTSFTVENYSGGGARGTLTVHGGIVQEYRGPVGTGYVQNGQVHVNSGYAKNYHYDSRFYDVSPPGYLSTGTYALLAWQEVSCD